MYGEGGKNTEDGALQDGEAQLMMGRMVPLLQVCIAWKNENFVYLALLPGFGQFCEQNIRTSATVITAISSFLFQ